MTLGRLVYLLYHRPFGCVKRSIREGGPIEQWRTERGRMAMERAAYELRAPVFSRQSSEGSPELPSLVTSHTSLESGGKPLEIHMLVGTKFWFMAAYALTSLQRHFDRAMYVHFYDDGTLKPGQRDKLKTLASAVTIHDRREIDARIEELLPEDRFPFIRERLRNYPNLKKLTDPHVGSTGPKLVMDADILFFRRPTELLEWCDDPRDVLCATDVTESYGYSRVLMESLAGARIPARINVGITGLSSETLDWEQLEEWCRELITREKTNYYLEQALIAMLCARCPFTQLGSSQYITGPSDEQVLAGEGVMQHYVDLSKREYFRSAWRGFVPVD